VIYQQAVDQETRGSGALQEGANLISQEQFDSASASLQQALSFFSQARDGFVSAREAATAKMADEQKTRAEQEKLKKARAEQEKLIKAQAELEKLKRAQAEQEKIAKASINSERAQPSRPDIEVVGNILADFKKAYEARNIQELRQISLMSENRDRFLQQVFRDYASLNVTIANFSLNNETASAVVVINSLTDQKGNQIIPGNEWKTAKVVIKKQGTQWGKVIW
jgi:hypothetical protein